MESALVLAAGVAVGVGVGVGGVAAADVNTLVLWQASMDNRDWASSVRARPGETVFVRAVVSYIGTQAPVGLNAMYFQPTVSAWDAGATADALLPFVNGGMGGNASTPIGVVTNTADPTQFGRVAPWGRASLSSTSYMRGHVHTGGWGGAPPGTWLRVAQAQVTSWIGGSGNTTGGSGVPISQLAFQVDGCLPCPPWNPNVGDIEVLHLGIALGPERLARSMVVDAPLDGFGLRNAATGEREVYWFANHDELTGSIRGTAVVVPASILVAPCGTADFDGDGVGGTDADIEAFFACLAGHCCVMCGSADFDGDGDVGTDADIESFFRVLAGGSC
jgi:hypothetical protein